MVLIKNKTLANTIHSAYPSGYAPYKNCVVRHAKKGLR